MGEIFGINIDVKNLGPISQGRVTLKPLTIFVGPNNSGKTYLAWLIAGISEFNQIRTKIRRSLFKKTIINLSNEEFENLIAGQKVVLNIDLEELLKQEPRSEYFSKLFSRLTSQKIVTKNFVKNFWRFVGSEDKALFSRLEVSVRLSEQIKDTDLVLRQLKNKRIESHDIVEYLEVKISKPKNSLKLKLELSITPFSELSQSAIKDSKTVRTKINNLVSVLLVSSLIEVLAPPLMNRAYTFPAQRNTLSLDIVRKALKSAITLSPKKKSFVFPRPILKFLELLDLISFIHFIGGGEKTSPFYDLSKKLENVLGGQVELIIQGDELSMKEAIIKFKVNDNLELAPVISSSMVQQLIPLVLYLKYVASPGDLVIIDEPESNLHPSAQMKLVEILAELVNRGIWVIITTHTPYIVDHFNNLITAGILYKKHGEKYEKQIKKILKQDDITLSKGSFLDPEMVSAYLISNGNIQPIFEENEYIDWKTFGEVSDLLSHIYSRILEVSLELEKLEHEE